jgi:hypothetical protein
VSGLEKSLSKEKTKSKGRDKNSNNQKVDKTTGASSWNFYDQFSGTLANNGE